MRSVGLAPVVPRSKLLPQSAVGILTFLLSVWISLILPRQVVKPLLNRKQAVDRAAAGDFAIDFEIQGKGEVAQLANSVRNLVERMHQKV